MPLSRDLFDSMTPPGVWITIGQLEVPEADQVLLTIRLRETGRRSISASHAVSRYCPTEQLAFAAFKSLQHLAGAQETITRDVLGEVIRRYVTEFVEPF